MAVNIRSLKKIGQRTQDTVFGYITKTEKDLSLQNIPDLVGFVCLAYYYLWEYFYKFGAHADTDDERTTLTNTHSQYKYATGYGAIRIKSIEPTVHSWKFRINSAREYMSIGIDEDGFKGLDYGVHFKKTKNYTLMCRGSKTRNGTAEARHVSNGYKEGDIVQMVLDLNKRSISFVVNDENNSNAIAYENIPVGEHLIYRMVVCTFDKGDGVTLMAYTAH